MAWNRSPKSTEYTDDEKFDRMMQINRFGPLTTAGLSDVPDFPSHLCFTILQADLAKLGCDGDCEPGESEMRFSAMGTVTAYDRGGDDCRIEIAIDEMAGDDGKFCELTQPANICLCGPEIEKMEMEADCEVGDMIHLIGVARLDRIMSNEYAGEVAQLQIVALNYEDESAENREG